MVLLVWLHLGNEVEILEEHKKMILKKMNSEL